MPHNICMVSDFFYPNMGGVEEHIYQLSQCLIEKGHKVVVITHSYEDRKGVRWMTNGLKVYYVPAQVFYNGSILPTLFSTLPILREIFVREAISIVHCHGAFSSLGHDALFASKLVNLKSIFTDHSLFGFADASAIITNRFLEISLADVTHCICVSNIGKANTVLRGKVNSDVVYVIPNAVDSSTFKPLLPHEQPPPNDRIIVVLLSRLVYRKGVDLMTEIMPIICNKYNDVDFIIGGDGPKRLQIEEVRERFGDRIKLVGALKHSQVRDFLVQGHIFLNTSLTEAYCMAIVEAAASGLQVVSTKVGGIPEVLPSELIVLSEPTVTDLVAALDITIAARRNQTFPDPMQAHRKIALWYNWRDVARRTEVVYNSAINEPCPKDIERLRRYMKIGWLVGPLVCLLFALGRIVITFCRLYLPTKMIDEAKSFPVSKIER
ncbi:unnamed protein product [Allacma fusca]|uniref:phosphatidylinositol N-acetylglucosaminyltransferase n=1 Tax=Allacma fusca TaxID=39272 RepID=A0A8J2LQY8_9HEXA|nr:unnamed protein product [Allacma fusca]